MVDYDKILEHVGELGTHQKKMCFFVYLPMMTMGMHTMAMVFLAATPAHRCRAPEGAVLATRYNWSEPELLNMTIPWTEDDDGNPVRSSCERYDLKLPSNGDLNDTFDVMSSNLTTKPCDAGWHYDQSQYKSSITMESDIVCGNKYLAKMAQSIYMVGFLVGSLVFGDISDRFGRKVVFFAVVAMQCFCGIACSFAHNYIAFVVLRFFIGAAGVGAYVTSFVLVSEVVGPSKRTLVGTLEYCCFVLGYIIMGGIAYFVRTWSMLQLIISLPGVVWLPLWFLVTESPRWLLAKGRTDEARAIVEKMAEKNGVDFPEALWNDMLKEEDEPDPEEPEKPAYFYSVRDLVRTPNMAKKSVIIFINWAVITMVYYGLSLNTSSLGGDDYVNFTVSGLVEFPALAVSMFLVDRWGRRPAHCLFMIGGGLACISVLFVPKGYVWVATVLAMTGKFGISGSFNVIYIWSGELYPTVIRNLGMGVASMWARVGGIVSPFIALSMDLWGPLPYIIFGGLALVAGVLCLILPETLNFPLAQTLEEAEAFGKGGSFCCPTSSVNGPEDDGKAQEMIPAVSNHDPPREDEAENSAPNGNGPTMV
ncbi:organic cation transporter protein-like [Branchiostoma floridae]|uniref:Organic cation transporter protein-like n=1 Tax=Branchiostoma floridae TaxID=7739 RepID=A0A9J7MIE3_BRAFL|nr:organic cation transporter protein-like [Branchiostoma floridae]